VQTTVHLTSSGITLLGFLLQPQLHCPQAGLDITHLNVVLATLAQFHAASLGWKQSLQDDSVLDIFPFLSKTPCSTLSLQERSELLMKFKAIVTKMHNNQLPERLQLKLEYLQLVNQRLSEPGEEEINCVLGTVGLGAVSPLDLAFQYPSLAVSQNGGNHTPTVTHPSLKCIIQTPACAAITRVGNIFFTSLPRDLASWVFILSNRSIRQHYLLDVISNYLIVLTNALDLLGTNWEKFGINFHNFCDRFFKEVEIGLLLAILVAMNDTSTEDINKFLNITDIAIGNMDDEKAIASFKSPNINSIPLSPNRLKYLYHLLDDVRKFV